MNTSTIPLQAAATPGVALDPPGTAGGVRRAVRVFFALDDGPAHVRGYAMRLARLVAGLVLYGIGIAGIIRGAIGAAPWDVLSQGLAKHTGLSFGTLTVILSGIVLLCWIPLRQAPRVGTIVNSLLVGPAADLGLGLIPTELPLWARILVFAGGLLTLAIATGVYLAPALGPGPRDGLMTGLHRRLGLPIWLARTLVEGAVLVAGWMLGGDVGLGTAVFALAVGPLCGLTIPLFAPRGRIPAVRHD